MIKKTWMNNQTTNMNEQQTNINELKTNLRVGGGGAGYLEVIDKFKREEEFDFVSFSKGWIDVEHAGTKNRTNKYL